MMLFTNETINVPVAYEITKDENSSVSISATEVKQMTRLEYSKFVFEKFMAGEAAYRCNDHFDLMNLFFLLRHTNVSMFNLNFERTSVFSSKNDGIDYAPGDTWNKDFHEWFMESLPSEIQTWGERSQRDYTILVYTVPIDRRGHYDVSSNFIRDVSEILGPDQLHGIRRLEWTMVESTKNVLLGRNTPWAFDATIRVDGYTDTPNKSTAIVVDAEHTTGVSPEPMNRPFYIDTVRMSDIGSCYLMSILEIQRACMNSMHNAIAAFMNWIMYQISEAPVDDPSKVIKAQAIVVWLTDPRQSKLLIELSGQPAFTKLIRIAMLSNICLPATHISCNSSRTYVFADDEGMLQHMSEPEMRGYKLIDECDDAVNWIYNIINNGAINLSGRNMLSACRYPYMDNIPAFFWNGYQYWSNNS